MLLRSTSLKSAPPLLREATEYTLSGQNKRFRPVLALEAARLAKLNDTQALRIAAALECLHTYSLVHDDLPAMDDDDLRRGQLSCHKKYGEATAILVGDLLQSLSFELLASAGATAIAYYARAVGGQGMVSGQFLDMLPNGTPSLRLHRLKTGKLIEASVILPFIISHGKINLNIMRWARGLGLLFQITDDLLDATESSEVLGKTAGKDAAQQKRTVIAVLGKDEAVLHAQNLAMKLTKKADMLFPHSTVFATLPTFLLNRRS